MRKLISQKPLFIAAILFYISGLMWFASAFYGGNTGQMGIGAMFISLGSLYVILHKRKNDSK